MHEEMVKVTNELYTVSDTNKPHFLLQVTWFCVLLFPCAACLWLINPKSEHLLGFNL